MKRFFLLTATMFFTFLCSVSAQVTGVKYLIEYNESTDLYDCKIVITSGSATSVAHRAQFNAQYSIVIPEEATLEIEEEYMPLRDNQNYSGTVPLDWSAGNVFSASEIGKKVYGVIPTLAPASFYNDLMAGDTVLLFSVSVTGVNICDRDVQPYYNGMFAEYDITPPGDFSNGFTIGSVQQIYQGNTYDDFNDMVEVSLDNKEICIGTCTELMIDMGCVIMPLTYEWSTSSNATSINVCPDTQTDYSVTVTDATGLQMVAQNTVQLLPEDDPNCAVLAVDELFIKTKLYPNPATSFFRIESDKKIDRIKLYTTDRRELSVVSQKSGLGAHTLYTDGLKSGIYLVAITIENETIFKKVVIE